MRTPDDTVKKPPSAGAHSAPTPAGADARILDGDPDTTTELAPTRGTPPAPPAPDLLPPAAAWPWDRYEDLGLLGRGGMGEVRHVRDRVLGRELAMKLLPPEVGGSAEARARFLAEARLTARLQHPGIVPVHDCGVLPDGLLWFTMTRVRGRTLGAVIRALHAAPDDLPPEACSRLIDTYARACEAVAYAHGEGIVHRDLKPENIMIGELGEVYVMDWGIARAAPPPAAAPLPGPPDAPAPARAGPPTPPAPPTLPAAPRTAAGRILGTPAYMPPEQARGEIARIGPASDVYALGAILYAILAGRPPYTGTPDAIWAQVLHGPPPPVAPLRRRAMPEDLVPLCERAMARAPEDRPPDARALARDIHAFLDGARRRDRARALVDEALAMTPPLHDLRARARALRAEARAALAAVPPFAPADEKARAWELEDEARALDRSAALAEETLQEKLRAALREAPDLEEAHAALADTHLADLRAAEQSRDPERAARAELLLRAHARERHAAVLRGDGALTLVTSPEGAEVHLFRHVDRRRRLHAEPQGILGTTPLRAVPLPRGSYLLVLRAPGHRDVRYPVHIGRGEHWDGIRPGAADPFVVPLLPEADLADDEVYVPPGWFISGGDPDASESLPYRRRWADGFVARRFPVTQAEMLAFLDDLVARGREAEAEAACPRAARAVTGAVDVPLFLRGPGGRFEPGPFVPPDSARHPVASVSWHGAVAYAAWLADKTGRPFRLPGEEEREKAARGADGRFFPWGDQPETTWACMVSSRPGPAAPAPVDAFPTDESPYGIRGLAGNVRDWCAEAWTPDGPSPDGDLVRVVQADPADPSLRSIRGGGWMSAPPAMCRAAGRFAARPDERFSAVGFRLVRSV